MGEFRMPSLGADMDAGTVVTWLVRPGDEVHRGDIVAVVETEKSTIEVEVFESGRVEELLVPVGGHVPVGTVLARLTPLEPAAAAGVPVEATVATAAAPAPAVPPVAPADEPVPLSGVAPAPRTGGRHALVVSPVVRRLADRLEVDVERLHGSGRGGSVTRVDVEQAAARAPGHRRPRVSPRARRLAGELGLDVTTLGGTGPHDSVVEADVRRAAGDGPRAPFADTARSRSDRPAAGAPPQPSRPAGDRSLAMRRAIGALMARSKREVPHYYLSTTIDLRAASSWLESENLARPITARLVMPALLLKATALAVATVPEMNGFMLDERFERADHVHLGVAVSLRGGGLVAPALHDADRITLDELMTALRDLVTRARSGVLRSSEMSDPTITVTNLGELGVDSVFGVIYPPQVALVGFGRVSERPWAENGMVGARPVVTATLAADHRASDGHRGGLFLSTIDHLLQAPEAL